MPFIVSTKRPIEVAGGFYSQPDHVSRRAVATLDERLVFDAREWNSHDQGDNSQFWHPALILSEDRNHHEKVADVLFLHDGRISQGHIVNSMNSIDVQERLIPESGGSIGPLPDGTVIEVAPVSAYHLFAIARDDFPGRLVPTVEQTVAAYNARRGSNS